MASNASQIVIEISDGTGEVAGAVKIGANTVRVISLPVAFRRYSWLSRMPINNISGNLRGIVINAKASTAFNFAVKGAKLADRVSNITAVVTALASVYDESYAIAISNDSLSIKGAKLSDQMASAALRSITGLVVIPELHTLCHLISWSTTQIQPTSPNTKSTLQNVRETIDDFDQQVTMTFLDLTDGNTIYNHTQKLVTPLVNRLFAN